MSMEMETTTTTIGAEVTLCEEVPMVRQERWEEIRRLRVIERLPIAEIARRLDLVENLVKWVKTNFLPGRSFVDDEDLARQSLGWEQDKARQISQAHGQRPSELLAQERAAFGPLTITAASYGLYRPATVNRESLVRVDGNQYSVPVRHGGQAVDVRVLRDVIRLSRDGVRLAEHARLAGTGQRQRDPDHYAAALTHRPRARLVLEREQLCAPRPGGHGLRDGDQSAPAPRACRGTRRVPSTPGATRCRGAPAGGRGRAWRSAPAGRST